MSQSKFAHNPAPLRKTAVPADTTDVGEPENELAGVPAFNGECAAYDPKIWLIASDFTALALAGLCGNVLHWVYLGPASSSFGQIWSGHGGSTRAAAFAVLASAAIASFWALGQYTRRRPFWDEIREVLQVLLLLAVIDASLLYLAKLQFSRFWFISTWGIGIAAIPVMRSLLKDALIRRGQWQKPTIIVGTGDLAIGTALALISEPLMGLKPVAMASVSTPVPEAIERAGSSAEKLRLPIIPVSQLHRALTAVWSKASIIIALEQDDFSAHLATIQRLQRSCEDMRVVPPIKGLPLIGAQVHHLFRHEFVFLALRNNLATRAPRLVKRAFDVVISGVLLIVLSPLLLYITLRIRRDGAPAIFSHSRIGASGKPFNCLKFRTMVPNAKAVLDALLTRDADARVEWERDFKLRSDPRVTPIGAMLRRTSLDELPQLWNVLVGKMSLVGPRPIVAAELARYGDDLDYYLDVRPGITGLWQISGRSNTDYAYRVYLDSWYVRNWSLWYDIVILLKTIRVVAKGTGAY